MQQHVSNRFNQLKDHLLRINKCPPPEHNGAMIKARRIELFYDLYGITGVERSNKCIELLEEHNYPFLYFDPSVCSPALVFLISQVREKRFFHSAISSTVNYLLFTFAAVSAMNVLGRGHDESTYPRRSHRVGVCGGTQFRCEVELTT
jgi:hypothetical protein